jgi:hypothetical protein
MKKVFPSQKQIDICQICHSEVTQAHSLRSVTVCRAVPDYRNAIISLPNDTPSRPRTPESSNSYFPVVQPEDCSLQ